jgi:hypothetical protein
VVPRADMPTACRALEAWAALAKLAPGEPVFRGVDQRQFIATGQLIDRSVSRIVKRAVARLVFPTEGRSEPQAASRQP